MYKKKDFHRSLWLFTAMAVSLYEKSRPFKALKTNFSSPVVAAGSHGRL